MVAEDDDIVRHIMPLAGVVVAALRYRMLTSHYRHHVCSRHFHDTPRHTPATPLLPVARYGLTGDRRMKIDIRLLTYVVGIYIVTHGYIVTLAVVSATRLITVNDRASHWLPAKDVTANSTGRLD